MKVTLNITEACNYDCWYCALHNSKPKELSRDLIPGILSKIPRDAEIQVLGGEPTLYKHFDYLINCLEKGGFNYYIQTNLSIEAYKILKPYNCGICVSIHYSADSGIWNRIESLKNRVKSLDIMYYTQESLKIAIFASQKYPSWEVKLRPIMPFGISKKFEGKLYEKLKEYNTFAKCLPNDIFEDTTAKMLDFNKYERKDCDKHNFLSVLPDGSFNRCPYGDYEGFGCKHQFCPLH